MTVLVARSPLSASPGPRIARTTRRLVLLGSCVAALASTLLASCDRPDTGAKPAQTRPGDAADGMAWRQAKQNPARSTLVPARVLIELVDHDLGRTRLQTIIEAGDAKWLRHELEKPAGARGEIDKPDHLGRRPLHYAAFFGPDESVEQLLARGATAGARAKDGNSPLHWAVHLERLGAARALVEAGADPAAKNWAGKAPLDLVRSEEMRRVLTIPATRPTGQPGTRPSLPAEADPTLGRLERLERLERPQTRPDPIYPH